MSDFSPYANERIDFPEQPGNPSRGRVVVSLKKVLWISTVLLGGTVGSFATVTPGAVLLFVGFTGISLCFGHSLGMHRLLIHRSYACPKWLEYIMVHLGVLVGIAGPLTMIKVHDTRDWAQRQPRCHTYFTHDEVWFKDLWWQVFCEIKLTEPPVICVEPYVLRDPVYAVMERHWMLQQLPWALLFLSIGGWSWVFWGICSRVSVCVFGHWLIGYFAHNKGPQNYEVEGAAVQGHNVRWCSLLTMGECWHNNHHAYPQSARIGLKEHEWDPGWWVLCGLSAIKLVHSLRVPRDLPPRSDLIGLS